MIFDKQTNREFFFNDESNKEGITTIPNCYDPNLTIDKNIDKEFCNIKTTSAQLIHHTLNNDLTALYTLF